MCVCKETFKAEEKEMKFQEEFADEMNKLLEEMKKIEDRNVIFALRRVIDLLLYLKEES